jgi:hypothetical protein
MISSHREKVKMKEPNPVQNPWEEILSRESEKILAAFAALNASDQQAVLVHLQKMATEPGWHPEQVASALEALRTIKRGE